MTQGVMDISIAVKIAEPVKIGGKWHRPGDTPHVSPAMAAELERGGLLAETPDELVGLAAGQPGFDEQVAATARAIAEAMVETAVGEAMSRHQDALSKARAEAEEAAAQRDVLQERVLALQTQVEALTGDRDAARGRAEAADAEMRSLQARNHELEAELAEASEAEVEASPDPAQEAPKPSARKGAKTKG